MGYQPIILATGFEPFLGNPLNPSWEAVKRLPGLIDGCQIVKRELPVEWFACIRRLEELMDEFRPRAVLGTGQGYPTPPIMIERIGINLCTGFDNNNDVDLYDEPVFFGGPAAYFSTVPYAAMHARLKAEDIAVRYNFNAGQNQCNCLLYSALHLAATRFQGTMAGFLHVPMLPAENVQGQHIDTTARGVLLCVEEIAKSLTCPVRTLDQYKESL